MLSSRAMPPRTVTAAARSQRHAGGGSGCDEVGHGPARVAVPDQGLPDQDHVGTGGGDAGHVGDGSRMPDSATLTTVRRDQVGEPLELCRGRPPGS